MYCLSKHKRQIEANLKSYRPSNKQMQNNKIYT